MEFAVGHAVWECLDGSIYNSLALTLIFPNHFMPSKLEEFLLGRATT